MAYPEGKDTIVVYDLGEIENNKNKLVRLDYAMGKDKESELKTLTLESKKKIKILGLNKLPNSLIKDAPYVMKDKNKKVTISSITYNDETKVIGVQGKWSEAIYPTLFLDTIEMAIISINS